MKGAWWVNKEELDNDQANVVTLPLDKNFAISGPPGSGKTNLLLLRANHLYLSGMKNILVLVYTRSLQEFVRYGSDHYDFPPDRVCTYIGWAGQFLKEHGVTLESSSIEERRLEIQEKLKDLINSGSATESYQAILIDEMQDYSIDELRLLRQLTPTLVVAGDEEQKIYNVEYESSALFDIVPEVFTLKHHYRNGREICRFADSLASKKWPNHVPMVNGCNYDEKSMPSSVTPLRADTVEEQLDQLVKYLDTQQKAYPEQLIGVATLRRSDVDLVVARLEKEGYLGKMVVHVNDRHDVFSESVTVCVTTLHGVKGLEFRALNLVFLENLRGMPQLRQVAFTAVTRCKTSLVLFYSKAMTGFFGEAFEAFQPASKLPTLDDVFGGKK